MKDNFSERSDLYAKFRPGYPPELFEFIQTLNPEHDSAWDCGTGNGQLAEKLADFYNRVHATDISENQLLHATRKSNILYSLQPAENTVFPGRFFDVITVGQAVHWFNFKAFYREVKRVGKPHSHLVLTGYGNIETEPEIAPIISRLYREITGPYWDSERKYVDENYQTIPFPFEEITGPTLQNNCEWTCDELIGYLSTWSGVKHYHNQTGQNPIDQIEESLKKVMDTSETTAVKFPLLLRVGKINS